MRLFISHSSKDKDAVDRIVAALSKDGHDIWVDSAKLAPGDNISAKINEGLEQAEGLIVVVSENSFKSPYVQQEFAAIALQQISKGERRIIPVRIDQSAVPSYLADRVYLDLSRDFDQGLQRLRSTLNASTPESIAAVTADSSSTEERRSSQIIRLREILRRGRLTLVCGAGVSIEAGIPAWGDLLVRLLSSMMKRISQTYSLNLGSKAAVEFQKRNGGSSLILGKYLKNNLGNDFPTEVRDAIYSADPKRSSLIDGIVQLARPQRDGLPLDSIITFNFDGLIEENLSRQTLPNRPIFSEAINHDSNEIPVYHVHGYLPRTGPIPEGADLVFSEDAYHTQFIDPFSWSNLIQLNKLTQNTCLLVGISLTDPNMRRLLDVAWRKNPEKTLAHYIVKRLPRFSDGDLLDELSKLLEEQDANALGLNVVWIDDYSELPSLLNQIAGIAQLPAEPAPPLVAEKKKRRPRRKRQANAK
jgi:hypothetical protein